MAARKGKEDIVLLLLEARAAIDAVTLLVNISIQYVCVYFEIV